MVINQNLGPVQTERILGTAEEEEKGPQATENDDYYPEEHDLEEEKEYQVAASDGTLLTRATNQETILPVFPISNTGPINYDEYQLCQDTGRNVHWNDPNLLLHQPYHYGAMQSSEDQVPNHAEGYGVHTHTVLISANDGSAGPDPMQYHPRGQTNCVSSN